MIVAMLAAAVLTADPNLHLQLKCSGRTMRGAPVNNPPKYSADGKLLPGAAWHMEYRPEDETALIQIDGTSGRLVWGDGTPSELYEVVASAEAIKGRARVPGRGAPSFSISRLSGLLTVGASGRADELFRGPCEVATEAVKPKF